MAVEQTRLEGAAVRWRCDETQLGFESTREVAPVDGIVGQHEALEALEFAIECRAYGQNVYVRGLSGTGRMTMLKRKLLESVRSGCRPQEHCYVANFRQPDRPRLISLQPGQAQVFRRAMHDLANYIAEDLKNVLESEAVQHQKIGIEEQAQKEIKDLTQPLEKELAEQGLGFLSLQTGNGMHTVIAPLRDGRVLNPEEWKQRIQAGQVDAQEQQQVMQLQQQYAGKLDELGRQAAKLRERYSEAIRSLFTERAKDVLQQQIDAISEKLDSADVHAHLDAVLADAMEQFFNGNNQDYKPIERYAVNVLIQHRRDAAAPVLIERTPSMQNLLGTVESNWGESGPELSNHMNIRGGALLQADGGYLILEARDVLAEPGAWQVLVKTLKNRTVEIVPPELGWPFAQPTALKPEPIPVSIRVILVGDAGLYYMLDNHDPDFPELFKVLSDFDTVINRDAQGFASYAAVIRRIIDEEGLLHFDAAAVARLIEHGARVCSQQGKLTAKFSRVADLAREGNFIAVKRGGERVSGADITEAVARTKRRAGLPSKKFQEMLNNGTINVATGGEVVGQINGLAVIHAGPVVYGFPSRITATIAPGRAGVINIEGQAAMSGSIHTKGFHILGGLLRHLLSVKHPLTFSASLAFEQSYGGIDGDSASGAEFCCLLSALTKVPLKQAFAMTGAIDQHGKLQAIGGVNEKIEGFYETCHQRGLSGEQGVIIPAANAGELMLRADVQAACSDGRFHVHAVEHITQALEILTGRAAGALHNGEYPEDSLLGIARSKAAEFWQNTHANGG